MLFQPLAQEDHGRRSAARFGGHESRGAKLFDIKRTIQRAILSRERCDKARVSAAPDY